MAFEQFLPDYFAECEQHLTSVRGVLLELDSLPEGASLDGVRLQDLLRALHTLKGLSGMVGLAPAERVAHALEDALRTWRGAGGALDAAAVQTLFSGTRLLEACIAAKRDQVEPPAVEPFLTSVATGSAGAAAGSSEAGVGDGGAERVSPAAEGDRRFQFEFRPSAELAARGVGVESVRARLLELGELRGARPRVDPGGAIVFEFLVDVPRSRTPEEGWLRDGMRWTEAEPEPAPGAEPGTAAPTADGAGQASLALHNVLRVDVGRVDDLMRMIGELVVSRARLAEMLRQLPGAHTGDAWEGVQETSGLLERQLRGLREGVMRIRLVQVGELFERMRFAVRELARETGKRVRFEVAGQETEIDKMVVERMLEPLLHLVRNAVSHGIEVPEERVALGKPREGRLSLTAGASGDRITITVEDDGAGIDRGRVAVQAAERGLIPPGSELDGAGLLDVLCRSGFSTRDQADLASGRGVGMAVVRSTVEELGGILTLESERGAGTRFRIELPLSLMIVDALLVELAGQIMAVPQPVLREVFQLEPVGVTPVGRHEVVAYRGGVLPLLRLGRLFGLPATAAARGAVLVVGTAAQPVGLVVDRLLGLREIVVHPLTDPLLALRGLGGATELGDGRLGLVLDTSALVEVAREAAETGSAGEPATVGPNHGDAR